MHEDLEPEMSLDSRYVGGRDGFTEYRVDCTCGQSSGWRMSTHSAINWGRMHGDQEGHDASGI